MENYFILLLIYYKNCDIVIFMKIKDKLKKLISIYINADVYKEIKLAAAKNDRSISQQINNIFKEFLKYEK